MIQVAGQPLHATMLIAFQQIPVERPAYVPFPSLREFITHEIDFLAGTGHLVGEQ